MKHAVYCTSDKQLTMAVVEEHLTLNIYRCPPTVMLMTEDHQALDSAET